MIAPLVTTAGVGTQLLAGVDVLEFCDYYTDASAGGSERVAREVNRRLVAAGARLSVATAASGPPFADAGVAVHVRPARDLSAVLRTQLVVSRGYLRWAVHRARAAPPDVLYAHSLHFQGSLVAACVSRHLGIPLVTVAHVAGHTHLRGRSRVLADVHARTAARFILRSSRRVITVSAAVAEHCARLGAPQRALTIVENGVDLLRFAPGRAAAGPPTVLFVGRLIDNKGPLLLVDAADRLSRRGTLLRVVFVGDGPMRTTLERRAIASGAEVHFAGHRDDVESAMRDAHVVVRPSYTEGMPLTVLEAMASARCVVASDIDAHRGLVRHLENGLLHDVGSAADLAAKLAHVLRDPGLRDRLAAAGRRSVEHLTWDRTASGHADVLAAAARHHDRRVR